MNDIKTKFTTLPLQVKVKVVALYCYYIFGVVFLSFNAQIKTSLQPHLLPVSTLHKIIQTESKHSKRFYYMHTSMIL